jgi:hypothetical protein
MRGFTPIIGDVAQSQPDQFVRRVVGGKMTPRLDDLAQSRDDLAQSRVDAFDRVGSVDHPSDRGG